MGSLNSANFTEKDATNKLHTFSLTDFKKAQNEMIATSANAQFGRLTGSSYWDVRRKDYTDEEIQKIIDGGSVLEQQKLSQYFFNKSGFYKQLVLYYSTLLKYTGILIPNPTMGKSLSAPHIQKKYLAALDFVEQMNIPVFCAECAQKIIINGCYYGLIIKNDKNAFSVLDLPTAYCRTRFKDFEGNDIIEFDVSYFSTITDAAMRQVVETTYPSFLVKAGKKWTNGRLTNSWVVVPSDTGICFPMFDGKPFFLNIIPAIIQYDEAIQTDLERGKEEIRKIIVQKIPHLNDGRLLFEPEEAVEIHNGTVGMVRNNANTSVLTTYGDVEAIASKTTADNKSTLLDGMKQNVYSQAGVSGEIFAATGGNTTETSIKFDTAIMMYVAKKFSRFITNIVNTKFANSNINFKYTFLDITTQNAEKYLDTSYKLAATGYSLLVPALAQGFSQRDLSNIKDLENDVLDLTSKLIPPMTAFTQTGDEGENTGRPKKNEEDKKDQTVRNEKSIEKSKVQGGSE